MTAAPGPQQPDEVCGDVNPHLPARRCEKPAGHWGAHLVSDYFHRPEFTWLNHYPPAAQRPAAPSAQPDRSLSQQRRLAVQDAQPDKVVHRLAPHDPDAGKRVLGVVAGELLIQDDQCPITSGRCDRDCGDMCLRSPAQPVRDTEEERR